MSKKFMRKPVIALIAASTMIFGLVACSPAEKTGTPEPEPTSIITPIPSEQAVEEDIELVASMYEQYSYQLYNADINKINEIIEPHTSDEDFTEEDQINLVRDLQAGFPDFFGLIYINDLTPEQASGYFYTLTEFTGRIGAENLGITVEVPTESISIIDGRIVLDPTKLIATTSDGQKLVLDSTAEVPLFVKQNGKWFILPSEGLIPEEEVE